MNMLHRFTIAICLSASAAALTTAGVHAETTTPSVDKPAMTTTEKASTDKMSDADKRAKAADCTKQANKKKLHGSKREEFRAACKRK